MEEALELNGQVTGRILEDDIGVKINPRGPVRSGVRRKCVAQSTSEQSFSKLSSA